MKNTFQLLDKNNFSGFLKEAGWGGAMVTPSSGDAGLRRYFRLNKGGKSALLMDMSRSDYESGLEFYIKIADFLKEKGVRVPEIYYVDIEKGLCVIEDFGNTSFGDAIHDGEDKTEIYRMATDVLIAIRCRATDNIINLSGYNETLIRERLKQFVDFYMPAVTGDAVTEIDHAEFQDVWKQIESNLPPCPLGFCHADYHLENLMWRSDAKEKYGLIDFQDAFRGFQGYDLLNLLEDARQSVPEEIKTAMKERYCEGMTILERAVFDDWYVVLSAHFHCRVIGLFVKLSVEREMDQYLQHIPRLQGYILDHLQSPALAPLKDWVEEKNIRFDVTPRLTRLC